MWAEVAGGRSKQLKSERCDVIVIDFDQTGCLAGGSDTWLRLELLRELGGLHIIARAYVARAREPTTKSPSLCITLFSRLRHAH